MLTRAMLRRVLLAVVAISSVRAFAVQCSATANTHAPIRSKAATSLPSGWIDG